MTIHADYNHEHYKVYPILDDRIDGYFGITKYICKSFEEKFGKKCELHYNPLDILYTGKRLVLVSATRLSAIKGKDRMIALANALDKRHIDYVWYVFTNDVDAIPNEHIVYMKPRLDAYKWTAEADYLVQLSDTEGLSYAINEALYLGTPVIVTPLPYLDEIGVKDGVNSYIMQFDCSNADEIAKKILDKPKFEFKRLPDGYNKVLAAGKNTYKPDQKVDVVCLHRYFDIELNILVSEGDTITMNLDRAIYLANNLFVEILET
jgi:glycosyltransferase involved in cell wall biosynthesis